MPWAAIASAVAPAVLKGIGGGGIGSGGAPRVNVSNSSTSNTSLTFNPVISVASGGSASGTASGSSSGAPSSSGGNFDPYSGTGYGSGSLPSNAYDSINTVPIGSTLDTGGGGLGGLLDDPLPLLLIGGAALLFMSKGEIAPLGA